MSEVKRLNEYLEKVRASLRATKGEMKNFWLREERRTMARIAKL
jgi:hypothetical protein